MTLKHFATMFLLVGTAAFPVTSLAAARGSRTSGEAGSVAGAVNAQQEGSRLLDLIRTDAMNVQDHADRLRGLARNENVSWQTHSTELTAIREDINDMGRDLSRLEAIRDTVAPWQQNAIGRMAPLVRAMAGNATGAIEFLNRNESDMWQPVYRAYVSDLSRESGQISQSVKSFEKFAKVHREDERYEQSLSMKSTS